MDAQRWAVIESVYHAALGKEPGERSSYLAATCAEDPTLRSEVESLLGYADAELSRQRMPRRPPGASGGGAGKSRTLLLPWWLGSS
jgi:hypothetical protein